MACCKLVGVSDAMTMIARRVEVRSAQQWLVLDLEVSTLVLEAMTIDFDALADVTTVCSAAVIGEGECEYSAAKGCTARKGRGHSLELRHT